MWDLIVSVPDHCLSFYFEFIIIKYFQKFIMKVQKLGGLYKVMLFNIRSLKNKVL